MTTDDVKQQYTDELVAYLQLFRGEGFLSPGGVADTAQALDGVEIDGREVLDLGCGLGGADIILVRDYGANTVVGIDVERSVLERAIATAREHDLGHRIEYRRVNPGPLPLDGASFDIVFTKDVMVHIPDKLGLYGEIFRVLRPGGVFVGGDWLRDNPGPYSDAMRTFVEGTGLIFFMETLQSFEPALRQVGFVDIEIRDRNAWFAEEARREMELLEGPLAQQVLQLRGREATDRSNQCQRDMIAVLDSGEFRPVHMRAHKP
ncbi:MAG: methyltransferase domain-containing protein [Gammaproteobacteria bacterium]|nr:methyltransferase domain-containing protein [Gammaproteobacteria bacterium]